MTDPSAAGAKAALDGYEYQLDVSVFAALRLMLITKSATRITLEPTNEEDLEADLAPDTLGRVTPSAHVADGYRLVIQVKLRRTGPWTVSAVKALLNHGERRKPARLHLDDPDTRFLVVTNADATGEARGLLVDKLEDWPEPADFPKSLAKTLPKAPEGRLALWGVLGERWLDLEIGEILGVLLRVPDRRLADCRDQLRKDAQQRMRGTSPGVWTVEDLLGTIRGHGGYLASAPELEAFVPPANYQTMVDALEQLNAVVITGPSGTGKTLAAQALCALARERQSRLEVINVNVSNDPSSTRALIDTGPTLYYVEDPWGQYSLRGGAEAWTEQLPRLLREARTGHQYVVTSRTDMLSSAKADQDLKRWSVVLDADQYRDGKLAAIYDKHLDLLSTDLQAKAFDFRKDALNALETPLEVNLFFTGLADGPEASEADPAFYRRVLDSAHRDAVGNVVSRYLAAGDQAGASAVIWALLAARGQFDRSQLAVLQRQIRGVDRPLADALEKLVNRLVATRHLRQPVQMVSFAHPSVRAGFEAFLEETWGPSETALEHMIAALTQITGVQQGWALETAARALAVIDEFTAASNAPRVMFEADPVSRGVVDAWLEEGLLDSHSDFGALLQLASDVGTEGSTPSELARWFIKSVRRGGQVFLTTWKAPDFDDAWYRRVSADPWSAVIADRFVREQLPQDRDGFGDNFPTRLDRIATGLTPAYLAAAMRLVGTGFDRNVGAVAAGAIRDIAGYEAVLSAALDDLAELRRANDLTGPETWRSIEDGECNAAYEEGYRSGHEDDGYGSSELVDVYVNATISLGRWRYLAEHPRAAELARPWAQTIGRSNDKVSPHELRAVIAATRCSGDENDGWDAARQHWHKALSADLGERLAAGHLGQPVRDALVRCAFAALPEALADRIASLADSPGALVHLLVDLADAYRLASRRTRKRCLERVLAAASREVVEIFWALPRLAKDPHAVSSQALALLDRAAETAEPMVLNKIIPIMIASGATPLKTVERWLSETRDHQLARAAAEAAIVLDDDALVWRALSHPRADAREVAMRYLATTLADPLPKPLLEMAVDPGSRVRRGLVSILNKRLHPDHRQVLVGLIGDQWSDAEPHYDEAESYPLAREAACALGAYENLSDDIGDALLARAERTDDRLLGTEALRVAAQRCGPDIRRKIWVLATQSKPRWFCVDAIDALSTAPTVEADILEAITPERLLRMSAPLAASATVLIATHAPVEVAVRTVERVAQSNDRRALLLLGVSALADRDRSAATGLLDLLAPTHPARRLLDLPEGERLPATVLDDLGSIRVRRAVRVWYGETIEKE